MSAVYTSGLGTYLWDQNQISHSQTGQTSPTGAVGSAASAYSSSDPSIDIASISERAHLFSGLETLSRNNSAQFAKNTATIAQYLRSAAGSAEDPGESDVLNLSASSFEQASQSGNFADLFHNEGQIAATGEPEPAAVSQIYSHVLPQIHSDLARSDRA